jgi:large subunit ribosomal protein L32
MAVPRHKLSRNKKGQRRSHDALAPKGWSTCARCNAVKLPHRVCSNCGHYKGMKKIDVEGF